MSFLRPHHFIFLFFCLATPPAGAADIPARPGLVATYSSANHRVVLVVPTPDFGLAEGESVHPQLSADFTARWEGVIRILRAGRYTFSADASVSVDGQTPTVQPVQLDAGDHPVRIEFVRKKGGARVQLVWSADFFAAEPVPAAVLFHLNEPAELAAQGDIERGRTLVEELNCVACHASRSKFLTGRRGPDLSDVGSRTGAGWIYKWLEDPRRFRPQAVMPVVLTAERDRRDVAAYLGGLVSPKSPPAKGKGGKKGAGKDTAKDLPEGQKLFESVGCAACHGPSGISLSGIGSKFSVPALANYLLDPLSVDPSGRMPSMLLDKPQASAIAAYLAGSKNPLYESDPGGAAKRGEELVRSSGCVNCHTAGGAKAKLSAPDLEKLDASRGCLADAPKAPAPRYALTADDRRCIVAFIGSLRSHPDVAAAPVYQLYRHAQSFRCVACHALDNSKAPAGLTMVPPLTGVGGKLREGWIASVLTGQRRLRPWLEYRMPDFGKAVAPLAGELAAASGAGAVESRPEPSLEKMNAGQRLMGAVAPGLGCVACHSFLGAVPEVAPGGQGPEITTMTDRLRPEWFVRWMREPNRVQSGTAMPTFFYGKSAEETAATTEAIWAYLSQGKAMAPPPGLKNKPQNTLIVEGDALVMRCVLKGDGPELSRAICAGLPGGISYCFDPQSCRLARAWMGGFLDMTEGWSGRGNASGKQMGRTFYTAPPASPLYIGTTDKEPARVFRGYGIVDKFPEFTYLLDGVEVRERITPVEKGLGIVRSFELDPAGRPVFFAAVDDPKLAVSSPDGTFQPAQLRGGSEPAAKKFPGQILRLPGEKRIRFSVTITVKGKQ